MQLHRVRLTLVKEKEGEKEKRKIHIVPSVILQVVFKVIKLICICTCYSTTARFSNKDLLFFYMMNIIDQVSCKRRSIFTSHNKREKVICWQLLKMLSSTCYCHHQGSYIFIVIAWDRERKKRTNKAKITSRHRRDYIT
jgi:hypothetical protein